MKLLVYFKNIYGGIRKSMPPSIQGKMSQWSFKLSGKPFVRKDSIHIEQKFPNGEKGGFIMSADFELGWAWRYSKTNPYPEKMAEQARKNFPRIIELLELHNIQITFATVGHLFLESCSKDDHNWMKRIPYFDDHWKYTEGDWFDCDPHTHWSNAPAWYAPDLIKMIINSKVKHEVGTHTFTHIDFSDKKCPPQVAEDEIKASIEAMKPFGIVPKSIVFPGGTYGNIHILKKYGIKIYRKSMETDMAYPFRDEYGLLVTPSSAAFNRIHKNWSPDYYIFRFKKYIDKAIKTGTIAHLWFHPSLDQWTLEKVMPKVMEYAASRRDEGLLWIGTMNQIAVHIN